jgi:hypothetical protein
MISRVRDDLPALSRIRQRRLYERIVWGPSHSRLVRRRRHLPRYFKLDRWEVFDGGPIRREHAPIVRDAEAARAFYEDALGLSFEGGGGGDYKYTHRLEGTKHFGLWPLAEAAAACVGTPDWPEDVPVPQARVEFEVPDAPAAANELKEVPAHPRAAHRTMGTGNGQVAES